MLWIAFATGSFRLFDGDGETLGHKKAGGAAAQDELDLAQLQQDPLVDRGTPSSGIAYMYETLEAVFFAAGAAAPSRSASTTIGDKGSVKMP